MLNESERSSPSMFTLNLTVVTHFITIVWNLLEFTGSVATPGYKPLKTQWVFG